MTAEEPTNERQSLWLAGVLIHTLISESDADGQLGLTEQTATRGAQTPWHVQHDDDEAWYVLEGQLTFWAGDPGTPARVLRAGESIVAPRGVPHAYRVDSDTARFLTIHTPATHLRFFRDAGDVATDTEAPPPGEPDFGRMAQAAARHGADILGPPPGLTGA